MSLRTNLSNTLRECKKDSGMSYKDLQDRTGLSISSIRYALNGGNVGLDVFQKLFDCLEENVAIVRTVNL